MNRNSFLEEALPCAVPPLTVFGEAFFGDNSTRKGFKKFLFSVSNARITRSKVNSVSADEAAIESWDIEKIVWYLGCEARRRPPHNLNVTFIERDGGASAAAASSARRSRERPHFGRTLSFSSRELFVRWLAAMLVAEHGADLSPPDNSLLDIEED